MIQLQFINYLLSTKDTSLIILNNLNKNYFSDYINEWLFIENHLKEYNIIPDKETFGNVFKDFEWIDVKEPASYLINELFKDYKARQLALSYNSVRDCLMNDNLDKALDIYQKINDNISSVGISLNCVDLLKDTSRFDHYVEKTQNFGKYYLTTGFEELDNIIGGIDRQEELGLIVARTNKGKCLAKGTKVLMADGTTKKVEDVKVGDKVQSLNRVNTVLALHNGVSKGYKIIPNVGDPFIVSENHILTIMEGEEKWSRNRGKRGYMTTTGNYILKDIMIEDYIAQSNHKKNLSKLYRPAIEYPTKSLKIPPYILGLWLGDGTSKYIEITSMDEPIIKAWYDWANSLGLKVHKSKSNKTHQKALIYTISGGNENKNKINKALNYLKDYNLINNKHIPLDYLTSNREQRLELLAGLIDTDGYFSGYNYEITQKSKLLIDQIAQLVRGLGLKASIKPKIVENKLYYKLLISGNTNIVPTRLERKKSFRNNTKQDKYILTGFTIEPVEKVEYYGFMCDGDSRYLLADNTLTHNTWILMKMAAVAASKGLKVGLYSGEMSADKVGYRVDTLLGNLNNGMLTHGNVSIQNNYKEYIDDLPNKYTGSLKVLTPQDINGPAGVNALRAFIEKEHLDILFIDQISLLEDDKKSKNPIEKVSNISKDLKNLQVMKKIPIISVSQQNRNALEDDKIDTTNVALSDRLSQDSTLILGLTRDKKDDTIMYMQIIKTRDSVAGSKLAYKVDFNKGIFTYIPDEKDAKQQKEDPNKRYENKIESEEDIF